MPRSCWSLCVAPVCLALIVFAPASRGDDGNGFVTHLSVGAAQPFGHVDRFAGGVEFPETSASNIYGTGLGAGLSFGIIDALWYFEFSIEGRFRGLTGEGKRRLEDAGFEKPEAEYAAFELAASRVRPLTSSLWIYGGLGTGIVDQAVNGTGKESNERGYSLAVRAGMIWFPEHFPFIVRPQIRYQALAPGTGIPKDVTFLLGLGIGTVAP